MNFELTTLVAIGTDCTGSSNYHTITMTPRFFCILTNQIQECVTAMFLSDKKEMGNFVDDLLNTIPVKSGSNND